MATEIDRLIVVYDANFKRMEDQLKKVIAKNEKAAKDVEQKWRTGPVRGIEKAFGDIRLPPKLAREFNALGVDIGRSMQNASRAAQVALLGVSAYAIKLASDAEQIEGAFDVAFKEAAKDARDFSNVLSEKLGRDAVEVREAMTRMQLVITGTGVSAQQATQMVKALSEAGIDAGALFNTSDAEAFQKIISGLTGEAEPLKAFGVVINDAALKAELLRLGFKGTTQEASEQAKAVARANLILKGLGVAAGSAERELNSAAGQMKQVRAQANIAARELGQQLLPAFVKVAGAATDTLKAFNALPEGLQLTGLAILAFIAAGGPIAGLLINLGRVVKMFYEARAAALAFAAAQSAAGTAGGAGAAGAAVGGAGLAGGIAGGAVVGIPLVAGAAVMAERAHQRVVAAPQKATDAEIAKAVKATKSAMSGLEKLDWGEALKNNKKTQARYRAYQADLAKLQADQARRAKLTGDAAAAAAQAQAAAAAAAAAGAQPPGTPPGGGFGLTDEQLKAVGGGGGKKGKAKKAADERDLNEERLAAMAAQTLDAERDTLQSRLALADTAAARADLEKQMIDADLAEEQKRLDVQIANTKDQEGISEATRESLLLDLDALKEKAERNAALQREAVDRDLAEQQAQDALDLRQAEIDGQAEALGLQQVFARTQQQRRDLEYAMLDIAEQRAAADLAYIEAVKGTTSIEYQIAQKRLNDLKGTRETREAGIDKQNAGPLASYIDSLPQSIDEVNERMEALAANGIQSVVDGFADVISGARDLGDVVKGVVKQMIADFARLQMQRFAANMLGGFLPIPGHAAGTLSSAAGLAMVGERGPELVRLPGGSQVISNAKLRNVGLQGGGVAPTTILFDNRGAVIWEQAARQMMSYADRAAQTSGVVSLQTARRSTPEDMARRGARRLG